MFNTMRFFLLSLCRFFLIVNPGNDPGCLGDCRVSLHLSVHVVGRRFAAGARNNDELVWGGKVENTLGIGVPLFTGCRWALLNKTKYLSFLLYYFVCSLMKMSSRQLWLHMDKQTDTQIAMHRAPVQSEPKKEIKTSINQIECYRVKILSVESKDYCVFVTSRPGGFLEHLDSMLELVQGHQGGQLDLVVACLVNGHHPRRRILLNESLIKCIRKHVK